MNLGVWVHAGCHVDDDLAIKAREIREREEFNYRWMLGTPLHDGNIYSSQLSVFYALFHGWGDIAVDFLRKRNSIVDHRQWITEEQGETWQPREGIPELPWQELVERLMRPGTTRGNVPDGFSLVTVQFDRQSADKHDKPIPYMVCVWDTEKRCHIVDYDYVGEAVQVARHPYVHDDGRPPLRAARALADSGFEPSKQQAVCQALRSKGIRIQLSKGASTALDTLYKESRLSRGSATPGEVLVRIDMLRSQDWIQRVLHRLTWDDPEGLSIYEAPPKEHEDLARQLLNEEEDEKGRWVRIDTSEPNDYRDCLRYGKVCMERETRGRAPRRRVGQQQKRKRRHKKQPRQPSQTVSFPHRPGGWI